MDSDSPSSEFASILQISREETVQAFLKANPGILLKTFCTATGTYICLPKFRFGTEFVSDFIVVQLWSTLTRIILIEIEPPTEPIFNGRGIFSSRLNGAIGQINDWFAWIRSNDQYFCDSILRVVGEHKKELLVPLANRIKHKDVHAKIVIGRRASLNDMDIQRLASHNLRDKDMEILAYDRLLEVSEEISQTKSKENIHAVAKL
jgi:hypothetical protein